MEYDLLVLGSGPGGYVAAIRAAQLGMNVAVIEKSELGGICLNWGCIPTKSLLKSAQVLEYINHAKEYGIEINGEVNARFEDIILRSRTVAEGMSKGIQYLFKKNKITVIAGFGKLIDKHQIEVKTDDKTELVSGKHIIIATGSRSKELPNLKQDGEKIIGYKDALSLAKKPASMLIVGSGAIGVELAQFYHAMGTQLTIVEFMPTLIPNEDEELAKTLGRSLKKAKIKVMTNALVETVDTSRELCELTIKTKKGIEKHQAEIVLSAVGITPNIENIGIEELGIEIEKGKIKVNEFYQTNIESVYAIGDIVHGQALAHVASAEAIACVEAICNKNPEAVDYHNVPSCIYTSPEVASVGMTEKMAIDSNYDIKVGKFPFTASGKASAAGTREGFVKLIFDAKTDLLLGGHLIGANVTEMIAELVSIRKAGTTAHQIIKTIHPHPTMSEAIMEAAAAAYDEVIHL